MSKVTEKKNLLCILLSVCSYDPHPSPFSYAVFSFFCLQPSSDVQSARTAGTRIPVSKGMKPGSKAVLGVSTVTRLDSRAEGQSMKIELRKATVCGSAFGAAGKSWGGLKHVAMATAHDWVTAANNELNHISALTQLGHLFHSDLQFASFRTFRKILYVIRKPGCYSFHEASLCMWQRCLCWVCLINSRWSFDLDSFFLFFF